MELIMKSKFAVAAVVLGAVLAAPGVVLAEDVVSDEVIRQAADQAQYNSAVTKRAAKVLKTAPKASAADDSAKRFRDEAFSPESR